MRAAQEILGVLKSEMPYLSEKFKVKTIAIFGSRARGKGTEESDIDMLIEFKEPVGFFKFIDLEDYLSMKLGVKVDLVTPDALKPLIKPNVLKEAVYV